MKLTDRNTNRHLTLTVLQFAFSLHSQSFIFVTFIIAITTVVTVGHSRPTNETPNADDPISLHSLLWTSWMAPCKQWLLAPKAASSCVTVVGMAQWLCELAGRWQRKALSAGVLCHYGSVNVRWTACSRRHVWSRHIPELRHPITKDELARKPPCSRLTGV